MAKNTTVTVSDDFDGSTPAEEVRFAYKNVAYTIDLSKKNAVAFDKALKPYLAAATKVSGRAVTASRGRRGSAWPAAKVDVSKIREWAMANGHSVNSRGRIPAAILDAYAAAKK